MKVAEQQIYLSALAYSSVSISRLLRVVAVFVLKYTHTHSQTSTILKLCFVAFHNKKVDNKQREKRVE